MVTFGIQLAAASPQLQAATNHLLWVVVITSLAIAIPGALLIALIKVFFARLSRNPLPPRRP